MWNFYLPTNVYFGEKEVEKIGKIMANKGYRKALLVCDSTAIKLGTAEKIKKYADGKIIDIFSDVEPNPTVENVDGCAKFAKGKNIDCVVALGGGSAMDCGKSVAASLKLNKTASELLDIGAISEALPVIAIPTTAGTGSEVTAGAVLSDHKRGIKKAIFGPAIFAKIAIADPELTYSCPNFVTAASGIDVIAHALDSLTSVKTNASTIGSAIYAAKTAFENLEKAYLDGNDKVARRNMSEASLVAGLAFSQTGTTGSHGCSYILTSKYRVPHGEACAFTLDWWFKENVKARPELETYARMMGFDSVAAVADKVNDLKLKLHLRMKLSEIIKDDTEIDEIVDNSMASGNMTNNIWKATREDVVRLFKSKR